MTLVSETTAGLRFFGDELDPDRVTERLGCSPSGSQRKGEVIVGRKTGLERIAKTGMWRLRVPDRSPGDLNAQIAELFAMTTDDIPVWHELAASFQADLFVGFFMGGGNEMIEISASTMQEIGRRHLSILFDIYDNPESREAPGEVQV